MYPRVIVDVAVEGLQQVTCRRFWREKSVQVV